MMYYVQDLQRLLGHWPWLLILRVPYTERLLCKMVAEGNELETTLRQYPAVRYEPLDMHYICLQGIGALSPQLFDEIAMHYGDQGRAWLSFHLLLAPQEWALDRIEKLRSVGKPGPWLEDMVLARAKGENAVYRIISDLFDQLAAQLAPLQKPNTTLRGREFDPVAWAAHAAAVKQVYKVGGSAAALVLIREFER